MSQEAYNHGHYDGLLDAAKAVDAIADRVECTERKLRTAAAGSKSTKLWLRVRREQEIVLRLRGAAEHIRAKAKSCPAMQGTVVNWSDREATVDLTDPDDVVDVIMSCTLDHSYDTTPTGVPYGIPDKIADRCAPVIAKCMPADWQSNTANLTGKQKESLRKKLLLAVRGVVLR